MEERDVCTLYLIRHGATAANVAQPPILQGRSIDLPLSPTGVEQVARATEVLRAIAIDAVYSSPLMRARETAAMLAAPHRREVLIREPLIEVDVGLWESRSWSEIKITEPEAYQRFQEDPGTYGYAGGETLQQVYDRVAPTIDAIAREHRGQRVIVVAHNVVNRAFLAGALGMPVSRARRIVQDNACINVLKWKNGETLVHTLNSVPLG